MIPAASASPYPMPSIHSGTPGLNGAGNLPNGGGFDPRGAAGPTFSFKLPPAQPVAPMQPMQSISPTNVIDGPTNWGQVVTQMVRDVNTRQSEAGEKIRDALAGGPTSMHEAIIAGEEAGVAFTFVSEVRNKAVEAYQQVMNMHI